MQHRRRMAGPGDMFPVRVLVETVRPAHCLGCAHDGNALVDTFAVVGGQTMLCQLVETVLAALGLPQLVQDSKGGRIREVNGFGWIPPKNAQNALFMLVKWDCPPPICSLPS